MDTSEPSGPTPGAHHDPSEAGEDGADPREPGGADPERPLLAWPPPGLGRLQGDLWQVIRQGAIGAMLLILPLLWSVTSQQEFWSLGPFGGSWWIVLITAGVGLAILGSALVGLFRIFRRAGRATSQGYGWLTVAVVAVDSQRDAGFLLQGARAYSVLSARTRRRLVLARLGSGLLYLLAVLWLPLGFVLGVVGATRTGLTPSGLALLTLAPAGALLLLGVILRLLDTRIVRSARRRWFRQPWSQDLAMADVIHWNDAFDEAREEPVPGPGGRGGGGRFRIIAGGVLFLAALIILPSLTMLFSTAMGPVLATLSAPEFSATQEKAAAVEAYRRYTVPADSSIGPREAGGILHSLAYVGTDLDLQEMEQEPVTVYGEPWIPDVRGGPTGIFPGRWSTQLMPRAVAGDLGPDEVEFLEEIAAHVAHGAMARLARAPAMDVVGTRWPSPLPERASWVRLPIPKLSPLREASWASVGAAALDASQGRVQRAEERLRQLISVGFLLGDQGPTILDNLIGYVLVATGGEALEHLLEGTGRDEEAEALRWARRTSDRTAELVDVGETDDLEAALRAIPSIVENPAAIRGLRWEYFAFMNTVAPCLNLQKVVFGPGESYEQWIRTARSGLVRYESEEELFDRLQRGWFGTGDASGDAGVLGAVMNLTLGGRGEAGSCATMVENMQSIGAL